MTSQLEMPETRHTDAGPTIHVVPHTHWDREWYEPFQVFRMKLVELVDHVLELLEAEPAFRFTLDGQLATVDDYLEVRPEAEARIRRHVAEGRLAIGPWQILMDEFLVSGETIVRNLQRGWERATDLGGGMEIGYLPDMFGHVAQMPQILRRAGMGDAVVWRGVPAAVDRNYFAWRSPDGSTVRAEYLVGGYGNGAFLFAVPGRATEKVRAHHALMRPFYGDQTIVAMYGTDHMSPVRETVSLVEAVNEAQGDIHVRLDTLADYLAASRAADREEPLLLEGELRSSARANMLMGVTSAHMDIKAAAARAERWLARYAEPLQALHGDVWPARLLELAWRRVIDNSAHDSICGCSVDAVASQVLVRFAEAEQIARGLARRALAPAAAQTPRGSWLAANPSPHDRCGLVEITVGTPDEWSEVALELADGRRVAAQEMGRNRPALYEARFSREQVLVYMGRELMGRNILGRSINAGRVEQAAAGGAVVIELDDDPHPEWLDMDQLRHELETAVAALEGDDWVFRAVASPRRTLRAVVPVPALGVARVRPVAGRGDVVGAVVSGDRSLSNGLLEVTVDEDGTLTLANADARVGGVGRLVDGGDAGDSYNYAPVRRDTYVEHPTSVEYAVTAGGPVIGELAVRRTYDWPTGLTDEADARTSETVTTEVVTHVELRAGEPFARLRVALHNQARDHRLRLHVPLPRTADRSAAEGQYAVVERGTTLEGGIGEYPLPTFPAYGFVDAGGMAVLCSQITEYELLDGRELALTCLRSTGLISRNNHAYREVPAGPELPIPAAQMLGRHSLSFALYPHAGEWAEADVLRLAEEYAHDFLALPGTAPRDSARAPASSGSSGVTLSGRGVVMTALHRRGEWLELRVVAESGDATQARIGGGFVEARDADLLGRPGTDVPVHDGAVTLELGPWEIRTIQLRR